MTFFSKCYFQFHKLTNFFHFPFMMLYLIKMIYNLYFYHEKCCTSNTMEDIKDFENVMYDSLHINIYHNDNK
jgi:hypothetical protein